jgi:predicted DNA-binding transcriptional regulator YafY
MARGNQLARQWKIFQILVSSKFGKSVVDIANDLDCSDRTVYRDLDALQVAGFPIYDEKVSGKKHWRLLDAAKQQIPIPFSLPELTALYFGQDALKALKNTIFYDSLESLFKKIKTTLPPESKEYLSKIQRSLRAAPKPYKKYSQFENIIEQVNAAVINKRIVEIIYYSMGRQKVTQREVVPYKIWFFDGGFYLIGYCKWRKDIRVFAIDRIKRLHLTDKTFNHTDDIDIDELMRDSFGVFCGKPVKVKIHFSADIAGYIEERIWHASQKIQKLDDDSIIFEAEVAGIEEIKYWIMRWGSKAYVLEPQELKDELQLEATGMQIMYENGIMQEEKLLTA